MALPNFGPRNRAGFRTVSFYKRGKEILKVSLHPKRIEDYLREDVFDRGGAEGYSDLEMELLKAVAKKIIANPNSPFDSEEAVLAAMRPVAAERIADAMQESFPFVAQPALQVIINVFVKKGLNDLMDDHEVRRVTDAALTEKLLAPFRRSIEKLLNKKGPPRGTNWSKPEIQKLRLLPETIRNRYAQGLPTSRVGCAQDLRIQGSSPSAKAKKLARLQRTSGDERDWPTTVAEALNDK